MISFVVKWIAILEGDGNKISLLPTVFNGILEALDRHLKGSLLSEVEDAKLLEALQKRSTFTLHHTYFAMNLFEPKLDGNGLTRLEQIQGQKLIYNPSKTNQISGNAKTELSEYLDGSDLYSNSYIQRRQLLSVALAPTATYTQIKEID